MKTIPPNITTHLQSDLRTLTSCWELKRKDGVIIRFTEHDEDITITDNTDDIAGTYLSSQGYTSSTVSNNIDLSVDQLDVIGVLDSSGITEEDLQAGLYDNADVRIFLVNWQDPDGGIIKLRRGWLGDVTINEVGFVAELRGMMQALQEENGETYGSTCTASFGDDRCKINIDPPAWLAATVYSEISSNDIGSGDTVKPSVDNGLHYQASVGGTSGASEPSWPLTVGATVADGTVTWVAVRSNNVNGTVLTATDRSSFSDTSIGFPAGWFSGGLLTWTSGANINQSMEVKEYDSTNFELFMPMPSDIAVGDTFTVVSGCLKRLQEDCRDKFSNKYNFRAMPFIPGVDQVSKFGGQ